MRHTIKVPSLGGDPTSPIVVVQWHAAVGAMLNEGDPMLIVETDKVDTEVPAPMTGTLVEILAPDGTELAVGAALCVIEQ